MPVTKKIFTKYVTIQLTEDDYRWIYDESYKTEMSISKICRQYIEDRIADERIAARKQSREEYLKTFENISNDRKFY